MKAILKKISIFCFNSEHTLDLIKYYAGPIHYRFPFMNPIEESLRENYEIWMPATFNRNFDLLNAILMKAIFRTQTFFIIKTMLDQIRIFAVETYF